MSEPIYIWEVLIPSKIEHLLYKACILNGIDIYDDDVVYFSDYVKCAGQKGFYADVIITASDKDMIRLYHRLCELKAENTTMWIVDEIIEEIEEENELWQKQ